MRGSLLLAPVAFIAFVLAIGQSSAAPSGGRVFDMLEDEASQVEALSNLDFYYDKLGLAGHKLLLQLMEAYDHGSDMIKQTIVKIWFKIIDRSHYQQPEGYYVDHLYNLLEKIMSLKKIPDGEGNYYEQRVVEMLANFVTLNVATRDALIKEGIVRSILQWVNGAYVYEEGLPVMTRFFDDLFKHPMNDEVRAVVSSDLENASAEKNTDSARYADYGKEKLVAQH